MLSFPNQTGSLHTHDPLAANYACAGRFFFSCTCKLQMISSVPQRVLFVLPQGQRRQPSQQQQPLQPPRAHEPWTPWNQQQQATVLAGTPQARQIVVADAAFLVSRACGSAHVSWVRGNNLSSSPGKPVFSRILPCLSTRVLRRAIHLSLARRPLV